jgi:hypothetical protein
VERRSGHLDWIGAGRSFHALAQSATPPSAGRLVLSALVLAAERTAASGPRAHAFGRKERSGGHESASPPLAMTLVGALSRSIAVFV